MELINRYVQTVTERLPEDTREDVARELRGNIEDMLPDKATEKDVRAVLEKLGTPAILSNEYRQKKRYLIGPALYDTYTSVLKLVVSIVAVTFTCLALFGIITEPMEGGPVKYIIDVIAAAFEGVIQAFLWVTLVFAILERMGIPEGSLPFKKEKGSCDDLPPATRYSGSRIHPSEAVVSLICRSPFDFLKR
jgi:hypothetical protein